MNIESVKTAISIALYPDLRDIPVIVVDETARLFVFLILKQKAPTWVAGALKHELDRIRPAGISISVAEVRNDEGVVDAIRVAYRLSGGVAAWNVAVEHVICTYNL